jgi:transposase
MVGAFLAGFLNGSTVPAQNAASQAVRRLHSSQEVTPAPSEDFQTPTDEQIQLLRKDIRAQRKQLIAANMKLSGAEAEKFWPIYEAYVDELVAINRTKYDLLKQYAAGYDTMTDQEAQASVGRWVSVDESVAQLRIKYIPTFRRVLSARNTALFFQLDRRIQLMIDLQLVSQLPLIEP